MAFDIVGDVHGHADALEGLLLKLGYRQKNGAWHHPDRHLVFVGDLIDRGPRQIDTVNLARRMVDAGSATVIMGNHEFNAIGWATESERNPGQYLRLRNVKNRNQHSAFLEAVGEDSAFHREIIKWFCTLPLWLDKPDFAVVHACWHGASREVLTPFLTRDGALTEDIIQRVFTRGDEMYKATEIILKGLETPLPRGLTFIDKDNVVRKEARIRWWSSEPATYRTATIVDADIVGRLPEDSIDLSEFRATTIGKPVFFGHYWLRGVPSITARDKACLDFSIARSGFLCAYCWNGEAQLLPERLIWTQ